MKLFGLVLFAILAALTGGLYVSLRNESDRKKDWEHLAGIPGRLLKLGENLMSYLAKLFGSKKPAEELTPATV